MAEDIQVPLSASESAVFDQQQEPFFLCAGALVPYKRIDVAIEACAQAKVQLWVLGKGPERQRLEANAGSTVRFFGHVSEGFLWESYRRCRALLFPGIEDFGIVPVECLSAGKPVIAIQAGGVAESVDGMVMRGKSSRGNTPSVVEASGIMIPKPAYGSAAAMAQAIRFLCANPGIFTAARARENAQHFDYATFFQSWRRFAEQVTIDQDRFQKEKEEGYQQVTHESSAKLGVG
jgi:glycosyltransferase involved in cell wall biosynthesis